MEGADDVNGEEPKGLYMSLDDLISENKEKSYGPQRGARGRGRGPAQQNRFDGGAGRRQQFYANRGRGQGQFSERPGMTCFNCGQAGHISRECPNQNNGAGGGSGLGAGGGQGGGQLGPCFGCGQMGHIQRDCPMAASGGGGGGMGGPRQGGMAGGGMGLGGMGGAGLGMAGPMGPMGGGPMGIMGGGLGGLGVPSPDEILLRKMQLMQQQEQLALMEQQVLQMQQQQQQQRIMGGGGRPMQRAQQQAHGEVPVLKHDAYRKDQRCYLEDSSGDVVVVYKNTQIVRVTPGGDITLNTGGWYTPTTLASMNDALNVLGIRVTAPGGDIHGGDWSITDGRALTRYFDGVVLPSKGGAHTTRGQQLLQAFQNPNRGAAAAATAASNAAAAQAGIVPNMGYGGGGGRGGGRGGRGGVFNRLGGRAGDQGGQDSGHRRMQMDEDEDAARNRRLRAQGRYNPY